MYVCGKMTKESSKRELPPPPPPGLLSTLKAIGPGIILASLSIGAGEWIFFPAMIVKYGPSLMWMAAVGCILQAILGVESMKYTVYCGQPIHEAYMKLGKPIAWAWAWALMLFIPVIWPGWAAASATAITALQLGRMPGPGDSNLVLMWAIVLLVASLIILHLGVKIQRTLELINWPIVLGVIVLVAIGVIAGAPSYAWIEVGKGIFSFGLPRGANWFIIAAAIAYIPAGFGFNLMLSSYARDKGWGMGSKVGFISAVIGGKKVKISTEEIPFEVNEENLRRWKGWLRVIRVDSWIVMSLLTFITVYMTSVMAYGLLAPKGLAPMGWKVAAVQAEALRAVLGPIAWVIVLLGGFFMLFGTQFGLMDAVSRVITDNFWIASRGVRKWAKDDPRRVYYAVLYLLFTIALILLIGSIKFGWAKPYGIAATGANLGLFALTVAYPLQIIVNYRFLPKELRPNVVITILLFLGMIYYGFFLTGLLLQTLAGIQILP